MSAFMPTDDTIDVVVAAGIKYNLVNKNTATVVGQAIKAEVARNLTAQYGDDFGPETGANYSFTKFDRRLRRLAIDGAVRCVMYQALDRWPTVGQFDPENPVLQPESDEETPDPQWAVRDLLQELRRRNLRKLLAADPDFDPVGPPVVWDVSDREAVQVAVPQPRTVVVDPAVEEFDSEEEWDDDDFEED